MKEMILSVFLRRVSSSNITKKFTRGFCSVHPAGSQDDVTEEPQNSEDSESFYIRKGLPNSINEYKARKHVKPQLPLNPHILKVSILGEPNVGKSTLTNALVRWKVCAVSKKVHTTRKKAAAIFVEDEKQIVFLDTPGFISPEHSKKHKLEVSLVTDPENSVREADLIAVVIDAANKWTNKRINEDILEILNKFTDKKSILVLNKIDVQKNKLEVYSIVKALTRGALKGCLVPDIDKLKKRKTQKAKLEEILEKTENLLLNADQNYSSREKSEKQLEHFKGARGWPFFDEVFRVSALNDEGIDDLRKYFLASAKPGKWIYHSSSVTDSHPYEIAITTVRQVLLDDLPQEIPYAVQLAVKSWDVDHLGCLRVEINIICPKPRYKSIIIGKYGKRIAKFVENSRQALQDVFRSEIYLKLAVV